MNRQYQLAIISLLVLALMVSFSAKCQDIIKVKGVKGESELVGRISFEEASRNALNNAKVEALRKAGVSEQLQSYETLFRSEVNNNYSEFFNSDLHSELQGAIQTYEIIDQKSKIDPVTKLVLVEVTIDASVILYSTKPDPAFTVKVEGFKGIYEVGEKLKFSIYSTQKCYLHIFNISDTYTNLIFPNPWEKFMEIPEGKKVSFPFEEIIDYSLHKTGKQPEINRFVLVFTKKPIKYMNHSKDDDQFTTPEAIFSWVYGLTPDIRRVDYQVFTLR
jgi:hypothetical protein